MWHLRDFFIFYKSRAYETLAAESNTVISLRDQSELGYSWGHAVLGLVARVYPTYSWPAMSESTLAQAKIHHFSLVRRVKVPIFPPGWSCYLRLS